MLYRFAGFDLDDEIFALRRDGADVPIRPQALDVLLFLVRNRERVVTKQELLAAVWRGAVVSENTLPQAIVAVRRALEDDGADSRSIQTVRARGYRFIAEIVVSHRPGEEPSASARSGPFVGREDCSRRLEDLLRGAIGGRGGIALITGLAGTGKTTTLARFAERGRAEEAIVLEARCDPTEGTPAFWPWVQVLRQLADHSRTAGAPEAAQLAAELGGRPEASHAEDPQGRFLVFDRALQILRTAARGQPVLVLFDDLHHADAGSVLLLKHAVSSLRDARVALAVTYVDAVVASAPILGRTVGALTRESPSRSIQLERLSPADVAALAVAVLGRPVDEILRARLLSKTDGNPLLLTQMLHALRRDEESQKPGGGSTSVLLADSEMREVIDQNLDGLPDETRALLRVASVLGSELTLPWLASTLGVPPASLLDRLDEALRARVLGKTPAGGYRFVHLLVRDVLYRKLGSAERVQLHRRAGAAALEQGAAEESVSQLERALRELDLLATASAQAPTEDMKARARALLAVLRKAAP